MPQGFKDITSLKDFKARAGELGYNTDKSQSKKRNSLMKHRRSGALRMDLENQQPPNKSNGVMKSADYYGTGFTYCYPTHAHADKRDRRSSYQAPAAVYRVAIRAPRNMP